MKLLKPLSTLLILGITSMFSVQAANIKPKVIFLMLTKLYLI